MNGDAPPVVDAPRRAPGWGRGAASTEPRTLEADPARRGGRGGTDREKGVPCHVEFMIGFERWWRISGARWSTNARAIGTELG